MPTQIRKSRVTRSAAPMYIPSRWQMVNLSRHCNGYVQLKYSIRKHSKNCLHNIFLSMLFYIFALSIWWKMYVSWFGWKLVLCKKFFIVFSYYFKHFYRCPLVLFSFLLETSLKVNGWRKLFYCTMCKKTHNFIVKPIHLSFCSQFNTQCKWLILVKTIVVLFKLQNKRQIYH
jgi:hypothetical protein